jgi:NitT/TauT family transport system substrate-binding protein
MVSRHSAFYSPLLAGIAGSFFKDEGFEPTYAVVPMGRTVAQYIASDDIDVTVGGIGELERAGARQATANGSLRANQSTRRISHRRARAVPTFQWDKLLSGGFMFVHGGQPSDAGVRRTADGPVQADGVDGGDTEQMLSGFRSGRGDWFHEQAPYPNSSSTGVAQVVASVGEVIGPVAFSSVRFQRMAHTSRSEAVHARIPEGTRVGKQRNRC